MRYRAGVNTARITSLPLIKALRGRLWRAEDRMSLRLQVALGTSALCFIMVAVLAFATARVLRARRAFRFSCQAAPCVARLRKPS